LKTDGIIFDLDGTLWDASASCVMAWNSTLKKKGVPDFVITEQLAHTFAGRLLDDIFAQHFPFLAREEYEDMATAYGEEEKFHMKTYGGKLYPGVKELLQKLAKEYPLFIVSNCLTGYIENFLEQHHLESLFKDYECSGNTGKPKGANIAMIISRNHLRHPVYIGDTVGDFEAAKQNHIPFIYAEYGFGEVTGHEYAINIFEGLKGFFASPKLI
jgi:phosphoglycolate phosphatase